MLFTERVPTVEEYSFLCTAVGWQNVMNFEAAHSALPASLYAVVVHDEQGKIAGMARVVGDGFIYFYIQDVVIHPEFQGQGLGQALLQRVMDWIQGHAPEKAFIGLFSAQGKEDFYRRFGFENHEGLTGMFTVQAAQTS
ncbi:GNAT family N-acetyltransferase [Deinococcus cellulosilyticus]|uniref:N-acetyltransferase n=1 Tax=Deinococcus cellulosilyticus (strain DSM 18568 / NBRC 106333 / KACC 11606 / 5516J-15) TaxID=1223518 RepID=A0A511MUW5_DEIC1|nr:GNAT family N-acetyltransferase [Deinococcus cellulosilyticus]GEM44372.1 N-acetyltransferase [Deinococcus cellulosilyticus NBRC 106333 = KACC 11606]